MIESRAVLGVEDDGQRLLRADFSREVMISTFDDHPSSRRCRREDNGLSLV